MDEETRTEELAPARVSEPKETAGSSARQQRRRPNDMTRPTVGADEGPAQKQHPTTGHRGDDGPDL